MKSLAETFQNNDGKLVPQNEFDKVCLVRAAVARPILLSVRFEPKLVIVQEAANVSFSMNLAKLNARPHADLSSTDSRLKRLSACRSVMTQTFRVEGYFDIQ